ncbi:MAG: hypothetical protein K0U37_09375 [Gammaproteobacteria bacterium]|nr:hypothetical protein [Gammaproteobacteria bacterium]
MKTRSNTKFQSARDARHEARTEARAKARVAVWLEVRKNARAEALDKARGAACIKMWAELKLVDTPGRYPSASRQAAYSTLCKFLDNPANELDIKRTALETFIDEETDVALEFEQIARSAYLDAAKHKLSALDEPFADLPPIPPLNFGI